MSTNTQQTKHINTQNTLVETKQKQQLHHDALVTLEGLTDELSQLRHKHALVELSLEKYSQKEQLEALKQILTPAQFELYSAQQAQRSAIFGDMTPGGPSRRP